VHGASGATGRRSVGEVENNAGSLRCEDGLRGRGMISEDHATDSDSMCPDLAKKPSGSEPSRLPDSDLEKTARQVQREI
jgi:hypothetical protein